MTEQTSTETKPKNAFIVRVKKGQSVALEKNVIGIGWGKVQGMDTFADEQLSWEQVKERVQKAYGFSGGKLGSATGNIWKFSMEGKGGDSMSIDDYVLMPVGKGFHLGIVQSGLKRCKEEWAENADLKWQRDVKWLTKDKAISRDAVTRELQNRLKVRQTCGKCKDLLEQIEEAAQNRSKTLFNIRVKNEIKESVTNIVQAYIGNDQLEKLIAKLCQKTGASRTLPKKDPRNGDADVQADYPVFIGNEEYFVRVLYQVKNHQGTTDSKGMKQLIDRFASLMNQDDKEESENVIAYKGCLVTTATSVNEEAQKIADENSIDIITLDKLVDWILDAGLSDLNV
jgi:hypothetical protein